MHPTTPVNDHYAWKNCITITWRNDSINMKFKKKMVIKDGNQTNAEMNLSWFLIL